LKIIFKVFKKFTFDSYLHKNFIIISLLNIFRIGAQFLIGIILVRELGNSNYGVYAYIMVMLSMITLISGFGLPRLSTREVAIFTAKKKWKMLKSYLYDLHRLTLISVSIFMLITFFALHLIFLHKFKLDSINITILSVAMLPFLSFSLLRGGILFGLKNPILGQIPEYFITPFSFILFLGLIKIFINFSNLNLTFAIFLQLLSIFIAFLFGTIFLFKKLPTEIFNAPRQPIKLNVTIMQALPFLCLVGVNIINNRLDILLLGFLRPSIDIGIYQIISLFSLVVGLPLMIFNTIAGPLIADFYYKNNFLKLREIISFGAKITFLLTSISVIFLMIFGQWILSFFYGHVFYEKGYIPLVILLMAQVINVGFGSVGFILNMTGHEKITLRVTIFTVIINGILNLIFVPFLGIIGSAGATAISGTFWNIVLFFYVRKKININTFIVCQFKNLKKSL